MPIASPEVIVNPNPLPIDGGNPNAVKVDGSAVTQPISGTITADQGTSPWVISGSITTSPNVNIHDGSGNSIGSTSGALDVDIINFPATQAVTQSTSPWVISGTVIATQATGTNLHTVVDSGSITANAGMGLFQENVQQFGGNDVVTGTGTSGVGIPRVTISNDSSLADNQSVNLSQVGGATVAEGQTVMASSIPITIASDQTDIPVSAGQPTNVTASWTNTTPRNTTLSLPCVGYPAALLTIQNGVVNGSFTLEVSDDGGTSWYSAIAAWQNGNTLAAVSSPSSSDINFGSVSSYNNPGGGSLLWITTTGMTNVRARLDNVIVSAGTSILRLSVSNATIPNFPWLGYTSANAVVVNANSSPVTISGTVPVSLAAGVNILGHLGTTLDSTIGAATAPSNALATSVVCQTSAPSLSAGQAVAQQCDYQGSQFVKPYRRGQTGGQATTIASSSAATTVVTAPAAGIFADLVTLIITPTAQSTGVAFTATLSDGTKSYIFDMNTGSTTALVIFPALRLAFNPALPATTAATAWTIALSSNAVTVHITVGFTLQKAS